MIVKRFASHYVFLEELGYLKQYAIEIGEEGYVIRLFPLLEEIESVSWLPGVITFIGKYPRQKAIRLYPFNFEEMEPVDETQHIPLQ